MIVLAMAALLAVIGFLCASDGIAEMRLNPRNGPRDENSAKHPTGR